MKQKREYPELSLVIGILSAGSLGFVHKRVAPVKKNHLCLVNSAPQLTPGTAGQGVVIQPGSSMYKYYTFYSPLAEFFHKFSPN